MQETYCKSWLQVRSLAWEDPLEQEMRAHSGILAQKNPVDRGAWWATVHGITELDRTENTQVK